MPPKTLTYGRKPDTIISETKKQRILFLGCAYDKGGEHSNANNDDERQNSYGNEKIEYFCEAADYHSTKIFYHAGVRYGGGMYRAWK